MRVITSTARLLGPLCVLALVATACGHDGFPGIGTGREAAPAPVEREGRADDGADGTEPRGGGPGPRRPVAQTAPGGDGPGGERPEPPPVDEPYEPVAGEIRPNAKRVAARVAEGLTNYDPDEDPAAVVDGLVDDGAADDLRRAAAPLLEEVWSRGRVVYPQLGGMLDDATSVMVVVARTVGTADGSTREETRTLDVRLALRDGRWVLDELASAGGRPVPRPEDLSDPAVAVLDDERIDLPDSAAWDIHRGNVDDELLRLMSRMAEQTPYGVVVLHTGHPLEVFGTERRSRHTLGKAVDVHRLGAEGTLVIEDRHEGSVTHGFVRWLHAQPELSKVGSPWALDAFGGSSFSDELHQDHIHVGVG